MNNDNDNDNDALNEKLAALNSRLNELTDSTDDMWNGPELKSLVHEYYFVYLHEYDENTREAFKTSDDPVAETLADFMYWLLGDSETPGYNERSSN